MIYALLPFGEDLGCSSRYSCVFLSSSEIADSLKRVFCSCINKCSGFMEINIERIEERSK